MVYYTLPHVLWLPKYRQQRKSQLNPLCLANKPVPTMFNVFMQINVCLFVISPICFTCYDKMSRSEVLKRSSIENSNLKSGPLIVVKVPVT